MSLLSPRDADRLVKLLGLLGSRHDGEIASAGRKANELIHARGMRWADVIADGYRLEHNGHATFAQKIGFIFANAGCLSLWEQGFLDSIDGRRRLSAKQYAVLDRLYDKAKAYAAARGAA